MKKILVFVLLLVCVVGAVIYFTRPVSRVSDVYYADYLPADTLVTVSLIDLKGLADSFPDSSLGSFLAKPTVHEIMAELGASSEEIQSYDRVFDGVAGIMTNPAFRQIFGDDAVAALLTPDASLLQANPGQELQRSLLVFGTSSVSGPLDSFARLVMSRSVSRESVDGLELTRIQLDENEVIYGYAEGGALVLAWEPENIVSAVMRKQAGNSLQETDFFTATKKFWAGSIGGREYARTYVNIKQLRSLLASSGEQEARDAAEYLQGFNGLGSVIVEQEDALHITSRVEYDFSSLHELVKRQYQSLSPENHSLGLLTGEMLAYYWTSTLDGEFVRDLLSANNDEQYRQVDERVRQEMGVSLEEFIGAVGPQFGLVISEIVNTGLFPLPKVVFFLQVRDHKVAGQVLDKLRNAIAGRGLAAEQSAQVNGHTIYFWSVLPGEATQPALVLTENMLYVANGKSSLEALLADDRSLDILPGTAVESLGAELVKNIEASNYSTFVVRPARLAAEVRGAADWLAGMLTASQGVSADKLKQEILKLMHSVDAVAATSDIRKDHAVSAFVFKKIPVEKQDTK
jgi:hypothetical protein